jgi:YegS/Rv2252/BmrU family lipid kinase
MRYAAIVNPHGGRRRGLETLRLAEAVFSAAGATLEVHTTARAGHARDIARSLSLPDCAAVCAIGGDGTVHEIVNGLMAREHPSAIPLGVIPAGSGNDFALHLGLTDPVMAARRILAGHSKALDVARVTTAAGVEYCLNNIGWGSAVDINQRAEGMRWLGPSRYALAALWQIVKPVRRRARLTLDGSSIDGEFALVAGCNTRFTGNGMQLAPAAAMDDGLIDVVVVQGATRARMLALFVKVFDGTHTSLDCVEIHQVRSFAIEPGASDVLNLDGELKGGTPVRVDVIPAALRVLA